MIISEALGLKKRAFISLVGAGGKSTLFSRVLKNIFLLKAKVED